MKMQDLIQAREIHTAMSPSGKITVNFPSYLSFLYVQVWEVTERKEGKIFKTVPKGFALAERPIQPDEVYSSLSTSLTRQKRVALELLN